MGHVSPLIGGRKDKRLATKREGGAEGWVGARRGVERGLGARRAAAADHLDAAGERLDAVCPRAPCPPVPTADGSQAPSALPIYN